MGLLWSNTSTDSMSISSTPKKRKGGKKQGDSTVDTENAIENKFASSKCGNVQKKIKY